MTTDIQDAVADARKQGAIAKRSGAAISDNPYGPMTQCWRAWREAFLSA